MKQNSQLKVSFLFKNKSYVLIIALKTFEYKETKILICISNVMTWSATPPKEKAYNLFIFNYWKLERTRRRIRIGRS